MLHRVFKRGLSSKLFSSYSSPPQFVLAETVLYIDWCTYCTHNYVYCTHACIHIMRATTTKPTQSPHIYAMQVSTPASVLLWLRMVSHLDHIHWLFQDGRGSLDLHGELYRLFAIAIYLLVYNLCDKADENDIWRGKWNSQIILKLLPFVHLSAETRALWSS